MSSKKKPQLSRKRILADAKLITTGPVSHVASGEWSEFSAAEREWHKGYVTAWEDIQLDITRGIYDKKERR